MLNGGKNNLDCMTHPNKIFVLKLINKATFIFFKTLSGSPVGGSRHQRQGHRHRVVIRHPQFHGYPSIRRNVMLAVDWPEMNCPGFSRFFFFSEPDLIGSIVIRKLPGLFHVS